MATLTREDWTVLGKSSDEVMYAPLNTSLPNCWHRRRESYAKAAASTRSYSRRRIVVLEAAGRSQLLGLAEFFKNATVSERYASLPP